MKNHHDGLLEGVNLGKSGINLLCVIEEWDCVSVKINNIETFFFFFVNMFIKFYFQHFDKI